MKRLFGIIAIVVPFIACSKIEPDGDDKQICIAIDNNELQISTKATAVTSLASKTVYWGAATGGNAAGSTAETVKWSTASATTTSASKINTGKYQTATATSYNYYVANANFTTAGDMTVSGNGTDIVAGRLHGSNSTAPSVTLNHIFARTGSLTLSLPSGYSQSSVSWQIIGKSTINGTAGTYSMRSQSWTAASTKLSSYTALAANSDMYLIPGTYTVKVTFTASKGDFSKSYTQTGDVTLVAGKVNNITATSTTDQAAQIIVTCSLTAWGTNAAAASIAQAPIGRTVSPTELQSLMKALFIVKKDEWITC